VDAGRREAWSGEAAPTTTRLGGALIVALPRELDDEALSALRGRTLERVREAGVRAVVFEASGLDVVDAEEFAALAAVARAAAWLGVRPMLVGLSAGLVRYLVDADVDTSAFDPFGTLDDALAVLAAEAAATARPRGTEDAAHQPEDGADREGDAERAGGGIDAPGAPRK
jgi:anti-anti-sigma regulatory factor